MQRWLLTVLCLIPIMAQAQKPSAGLFTFSGGYANYDVSSWSVFMPSPALALVNDGFSYGFGFDAVKGRTVFGISTQNYIQPKYAVDTFAIQFTNNDVKLDLGYAMVLRDRFLMAPILGLGGGSDHITIFNSEPATAATVAADPGREINLWQGKACADISLQMHWLLGQPASGEDNEGFSLGLQLGYAAHYAIGNWRYAESNITDGPDGFRQMYYARLSLGIMSTDLGRGSAPDENMQ